MRNNKGWILGGIGQLASYNVAAVRTCTYVLTFDCIKYVGSGAAQIYMDQETPVIHLGKLITLPVFVLLDVSYLGQARQGVRVMCSLMCVCASVCTCMFCSVSLGC